MSDNPLHKLIAQAAQDLQPHLGEFNAVVCGGDHHGIGVASVIAAVYDLPLMIVCMERHRCVVSHITCIGEARPDMRYLYVDDWFNMGATKRHVFGRIRRRRFLARAFRYFAQSGEYVPVVATYAATTREYKEITA